MFDSTKFDIFQYTWTKEEGRLPVSMTNDYLFKAVNQENDAALKSLICAALHREKQQIQSIEVMNPIELGQAFDEKEFILDIKVGLNDDKIVDMEMQVVNYNDWPERSLQYLCRTFNSLHKGEDYIQSKTAIHLGILKFRLFGTQSSLLDSYLLMNVKTHRIYTDKFQLHVLCLPEASSPTEEDKRFHTDLWAKYYSARTWEELKMLAKEDEGIAKAVDTAYRLMSDERIRERVLAREDYYRRVNTERKLLQMAEEGRKEAEKGRQEAEKGRQEAEKGRQEAEKGRQEAEKKTLEAEKSRQEAEKKTLEAEKSRQEAEKKTLEAEKSRQEAEKKTLEAEKRTRELEGKTREAEKKIREAEKIAQAAAERTREAEERARIAEERLRLLNERIADLERNS